MANAIKTHGLTKRYRGSVTALDDLQLEVDRGEAFGFIGPNGAGKTTAIRLLLGLLRPTSGSAEVLGLDVARKGIELRRLVGYLPGDLHLDRRLSARQSLIYFAQLRGMATMTESWRLAERLGLALDRPVSELSKGNRQKIGLIQAFQHSPQLVILDEPTSGLDPMLQQTFHELIWELREAGGTAFISSHILSELEHSADRVGMIRSGKLIAVETIGNLRRAAPHRVAIRFAQEVPAGLFDQVDGVTGVEVTGSLARLLVAGPMDAVIKTAATQQVVSLDSAEPDLEEIFLHYYREAGAADA